MTSATPANTVPPRSAPARPTTLQPTGEQPLGEATTRAFEISAHTEDAALTRVSNAIHETVLQTLAEMRVQLDDPACTSEQLRSGIATAERELRQILVSIRPARPDLDTDQVLRDLASTYMRVFGVTIATRVSGLIPPPYRQVVGQMFRRSLPAVVCGAGAHTVAMSVQARASSLVCSVTGRQAATPEAEWAEPLAELAWRAALVGGTTDTRTSGCGAVSVKFKFPIDPSSVSLSLCLDDDLDG